MKKKEILKKYPPMSFKEVTVAFYKDEAIRQYKHHLRNKITEVTDKKFPLGERKWCIKCAKRIKKEILNLLN